MKLNEFKDSNEKTLNELSLGDVIGGYGAAAAQQIGQRIMGKAEGDLSIADKRAKTIFIQDFVGRASTNIKSALDSGLISINPNAAQNGGQSSTTADNAAGTSAPAQQTNKQANTVDPATVKQNIMDTILAMDAKQLAIVKKLLQNRARQKVSEANFMSQAASVAKGAGKFLGKGLKQVGKTIGNVVKATPGAVSTAVGSTAGAVAGMPTAIRKSYQVGKKYVGKGPMSMDDIQKAIFTMAPGDATELLGFIKQKEIENAKPAAKKTNRQTSTIPNQAGSRAIGQMAQQLSATRPVSPVAPVAPAGATTMESKYHKLNYIFESIVNFDEAAPSETIATYLMNMIEQYNIGVDLSRYESQIKNLANEVEATYNRDRGKAALNKLANMLFSLSYGAGKTGATATTSAAAASIPAAGSSATPTTSPTAAQKLSPATTQFNQLLKTMTKSDDATTLTKMTAAMFRKIKKLNPALYTQLIASIKSDKFLATNKKTATPTPVATTGSAKPKFTGPKSKSKV